MRQRLVPLLLVAAVALCYGHLLLSADLDFVYDDVRFISENQDLHEIGNIGRFFSDPRTVDRGHWGGIYRPLRTLDFAVDWAMFGPSPAWFHLKNVIYHALGVLLVFALLRRFRAGEAAAGLGALVFAIHPVQAESVAWMTSRGDVMGLFFTLLALWLHLRKEGYRGHFFGTVGVLAVALLSKESAAVFPALAVLCDFFFRDERRLKTTLRRWPKYLAYSLVVGVYVGLWLHLHRSFGEEMNWHLNERWGGSLFGSLVVMGRGFVYYGRLYFFPVDMAIDWYPAPLSEHYWLGLLCLALVLTLLVRALLAAFRRSGGGGPWAFAVLWFFLAMFPTSNVAGPIGIPTAERFLYLPIVGFSLPVGALLLKAWHATRWSRVLVVTVLLCLAAVTVDRTRIWHTDADLWNTTLARFVTPRGLGFKANRVRIAGEELKFREWDLRDAGRLEEAERVKQEKLRLLHESLAYYDRQIETWERLPEPEGQVSISRGLRAITLYELERYTECLSQADESLADWPRMIWGHYSRALGLYGLGRLRAARDEIEFSLSERYTEQFRRTGAGIHQQLAKWYLARENHGLAYASLKRTWELLPIAEDNPGTLQAIRDIEAEQRRVIPPLLDAAEREDASVEDYVALAQAYARFGMWDRSKPIFDHLLSQEETRDDKWVLLTYAYFQWQLRDTEEGYAEALQVYDRVLDMDPGDARAIEYKRRCVAERDLLLEEDRR